MQRLGERLFLSALVRWGKRRTTPQGGGPAIESREKTPILLPLLCGSFVAGKALLLTLFAIEPHRNGILMTA
jgi:hypothetical protein